MFGAAPALAQSDVATLVQRLQRGGLPEASTTPAFQLVPSLALTETLTSNAEGTQGAGDADLVTRATAGLQLRRRGPKSLVRLDYALSGLVYARDGDRNTHQHALKADADLEWLENRGFLKATASISQGAVSAFGTQPDTSALPSRNVVEVRQIELTPRWESPLGESLSLGVVGQLGSTSTQGTSTGDSTRYGAELTLAPLRRGPLGWTAQLSHQGSDYVTGRRSSSTRVLAGASREFDALDLRVFGDVGFERGTLVAAAAESAANWGLGLNWTPSPRTSAVLRFDRRLFGNAHSVTLLHQTPLTLWRFSSSRSLNQTGSDTAVSSSDTFRDWLISRGNSADSVDEFLTRNNLNGDVPVSSGFLRSASTIDNLQQASVTWRGVRTTVTVNYSHNRSQRAEALVTVTDDLSSSSRVVTQAWSLQGTHRLTADLTLSLTASLQRSDGDEATQSNRQQTYTAQVGGPLGPRSNWSMVLRRALYESALIPAGETSLIAAYTVRF